MSFHRDIGLSNQPREPRDSAATTDWIFDIAVKNGKLTKIREYIDTQALAKAAAGEEE